MKYLVLFLAAVLAVTAYSKTPYESMAGVNLIVRNSMIQVAILTGTADGVYCDKVTHSFIQGVDSQDNLFISVRCARPDNDFLFIERPGGTATILECGRAEQLFNDLNVSGKCWMPLSDPTPYSKY